MKKIIAILLASASLLSLAACKVKNDNNAETTDSGYAFASNAAERESERAEEQSKAAEKQSEINEEIDEYIAKVGKTKAKTQIVINSPGYPLGKHYIKYEFDKKGEFKALIDYYFFDDIDNYNATLDSTESDKTFKLRDKDKSMKMVAVEDLTADGLTFDEYLKNYKSGMLDDYVVIE